VLSRKGLALAREAGSPGFFMLTYEPGEGWKSKRKALIVAYYPLLFLDNALGFGLPLSSPPASGKILEESPEKPGQPTEGGMATPEVKAKPDGPKEE